MSDKDRPNPLRKLTGRYKTSTVSRQDGAADDRFSHDDVIPITIRPVKGPPSSWWEDHLRRLGDDVFAEKIPDRLRAICSRYDEDEPTFGRSSNAGSRRHGSAHEQDD